MFTRNDGPKALLTVIRTVITGQWPLGASVRSESLRGDVEKLLLSGRSKPELILEVLDDYEKSQPQRALSTEEILAANRVD